MRDFKLHLLAAAIAWITAPACLAAAQRPIAELKPIVTLKLGDTADWVAVSAGAVWVASTDYHAGTIGRIAIKDALAHCADSPRARPAQ